MKKVLVTGAGGFIGRHALAPLLARGYEVHAIARSALPSGNGIHWHGADLLNVAATNQLLKKVRPSHLLHFAWYAEHGKFWNAAENLDWVRASMNLLKAFSDNGGKRFVGAGTCAEYDWSAGHCVEGETALRPANTYGACKDIFRRYLDEYAKHAGMSVAWGRIFHLYGPGEHPARLVASVINAMRKNEIALCSHGEQLRDFSHVADVADAFIALLDSSVAGAVNIASGEAISIRALVTLIAQSMNKESLLHIGALPTRAGDPPVLTAATRRLKEEAGWSRARDLATGLEQTISWWRQSCR